MSNSTRIGSLGVKYFRPKMATESEYTFFPSNEFKAEHDRDDCDVGFFLRDNEILKLDPVKPSTSKAGAETIYLQEGRVTIVSAAWDRIDEAELKRLLGDGAVEIHSIEDIVREYLTD